ncbi:MAG: hypothetical protein U0031_22095 [Thermomicrobiales bacterium]
MSKNSDTTRWMGRVRNVLVVTGVALALVAVAPAADVAAKDSAAGTINIGGSISDTVTGAVAGIATGGGNASGGVQSEHNDLSFGDGEGLAISDSSGGNSNVAARN